jgi:hypothetical protein
LVTTTVIGALSFYFAGNARFLYTSATARSFRPTKNLPGSSAGRFWGR